MQQTEELRVCRACLGTDGDLHELEENGLLNKFQQVTSLNSLRQCTTDTMPKHICSFCCAMLLKAHRFRKKCLEINQIIQNAGCLNCISDVKKASMMYELSLTHVLVDAFDGEKECVKNIDQPDYHDVVVLEQIVAVKEEQTEIDNLQNVDGYSVDKPVKCNFKVISNDDSDISNTSNYAREGVTELAMAIDLTAAIKTECNIKNELFEILPKELDENVIECNYSHEVFKEEIIHNTEVNILDNVEDVNAINIHGINESSNEESMHNTEVDLLKEVKDNVNAIDITSTIKSFKINSKRKVSTTLKGNTMKRLNCIATISESDITKRKYLKKSVHTDRRPFCCDACGKVFKTRGALQIHTRQIHSEARPYPCLQCGMVFKFPRNLKIHQQVHTDRRRFGCDTCGKMFKTRHAILVHFAVHSNTRRYPCEQCGKNFKSAPELRAHQKRVHMAVDSDALPHTCEQCGKTFKQLDSLKAHKRRGHTDIRPFGCDTCGKMFKTTREVQVHTRRVHSEARPYSCALCGKAFKLPGILKKHQQVHIDSDALLHSCEQCGKTFRKLDSLKAHKRRGHTDIRPFGCDTCGKAFKTRGAIQVHIATHSDALPHTCDQCGKTFTQLDRFKAHKQRMHIDIRPFCCDACGKMFKTKRDMQKHTRRVHSEAEPYPCAQCGKAFKLRYNVKKHELVHTGERPFGCDVCGKTYLSKGALQTHINLSKSSERNQLVSAAY